MAEEEGVKDQYPVGTSVNYLGGDENKKKYAKNGTIHRILEANNIYVVEFKMPNGTTQYERVLKDKIYTGGRKKSHRRKQTSRKHKSRRHVNKRGLSR